MYTSPKYILPLDCNVLSGCECTPAVRGLTQSIATPDVGARPLLSFACRCRPKQFWNRSRLPLKAVSLSRKTNVDKDGGTDPQWDEVRNKCTQKSAQLQHEDLPHLYPDRATKQTISMALSRQRNYQAKTNDKYGLIKTEPMRRMVL